MSLTAEEAVAQIDITAAKKSAKKAAKKVTQKAIQTATKRRDRSKKNPTNNQQTIGTELDLPTNSIKSCFKFRKPFDRLKTLYSTNSEVKMWVKKLMALSLVPLDQIEDGLEYLLDE